MSRFRLRHLAAPLVCVFLAVTAAAAGQVVTTEQEREQRAAELKRYRAVVNAYRGGDSAAAKTILEWDLKRLDAIVTAVDTALDPTRPWSNEQFKAAAMLHTDAAVERLYEDEQRVGHELDLGGRLLQKGGPELHEFSREWYSILARTLRGVSLFNVAEQFLENGRKRQPKDAVLLFESGVLQEHIATFAAFFVQIDVGPGPPRPGGAVQSHGAPWITSGPHPSITENRRALNDAADWLHESLAVDVSNEVAQLHLGRVQMLRGSREAAKLLERLAESSATSGTAYLATLFLAAMETRKGEHALAEKRYRSAVEKLPTAQSAYVGLSETLQRQGRGDESRESIRGVLLRSSNAVTEPWWWYLSDPHAELRRRLGLLRAAVRQ